MGTKCKRTALLIQHLSWLGNCFGTSYNLVWPPSGTKLLGAL